MKSEIQRLFGLPYDKINVIPNGLNMTAFSGLEKDYGFRRQYAADNEKIILTMGRMVYEKGIQHLIAAMPKILANYHDAKLVVVGKGGMIDDLKMQADALGISQKVYFAGFLNSRKVPIYQCSDIAVFPSTYEPFGIVALEAMLAGIPTVVSDVGGLGEIIKHGINGMKSYAGNPNSIADSILELLYNPELCANITKTAKAEVKENYNWTKLLKIHTLFIKKLFAKQWHKDKQIKSLKRRTKKQKKQKYRRRNYKFIGIQKETCICIIKYKERTINYESL